MDVTTTVFLTDLALAGMADFRVDGRRFVFAPLDAIAGPALGGPAWAFIDWVMPEMAGLEMCRRLRADALGRSAHITLVLESDDAEDRRRALRAGADDYVVGPLDRAKVLERLLAVAPLLEQQGKEHQLVAGPLSIDMAARQARWAGKPVVLPPNEFSLLRFLAENPNRVLTREELIAGLGKGKTPPDERTVDVWVGRVRRAFRAAGAGNPLRTVRSAGYAFDTN